MYEVLLFTDFDFFELIFTSAATIYGYKYITKKQVVNKMLLAHIYR